ncbi:MAG: hypothetical protein K0B81_06455 [Candidatus Cloacimonetes bacterium]|nr:hypothetical protein [Candidatus Cloacimonadota bacterium]
MRKNIQTKIKNGLYSLFASLCLLIVILLITDRPMSEVISVLRITFIVVFIIAILKLYIWLKKEE